jgi:hypothetical protein
VPRFARNDGNPPARHSEAAEPTRQSSASPLRNPTIRERRSTQKNQPSASTHATRRSARTQTSAATAFEVAELALATTPTPGVEIPDANAFHPAGIEIEHSADRACKFTFSRARFSKIHFSCLGAVMPTQRTSVLAGVDRGDHRVIFRGRIFRLERRGIRPGNPNFWVDPLPCVHGSLPAFPRLPPKKTRSCRPPIHASVQAKKNIRPRHPLLNTPSQQTGSQHYASAIGYQPIRRAQGARKCWVIQCNRIRMGVKAGQPGATPNIRPLHCGKKAVRARLNRKRFHPITQNSLLHCRLPARETAIACV